MKKYLIFFLVLLFLAGCQEIFPGMYPSDDDDSDTPAVVDPDPDPDPGTDSEPGPVEKINFAGAKSAVIANQSTAVSHNYKWWNPARYLLKVAYAAAGDEVKLFKITDEGYYLEVTYEDASGDTTTLDYPPVSVFRVNSDYSAVYFMYNAGSYAGLEYALPNANEVFLVNNTTGSAVSIKANGVPLMPPNYYVNAPVFRESQGFVYYIAEAIGESRRQVVKINPATAEMVVVTPTIDHVQYFEVDSAGNTAYWGNQYNTATFVAKLVLADGSVSDIPFDTVSYIMNVWRGSDGKLYYYKPDPAHGQSDIYRIDISGASVTYTIYIENTVFDVSSSDDRLFLKTNDRVIIQHDVDSEYIEVQNADASADMINNADLGLSAVATATADDLNFYFAGTDINGDSVLIKLTRSGGGANIIGSPPGKMLAVSNNTTVLSVDEYSIGKMVPNGSGGIIFSGTRVIDAVKIIGEINSLGDSTIYTTGTDAEAQAIAQLN